MELIEISHKLFRKKLTVLESQAQLETNSEKKEAFRKKALQLFSEYKSSLQVIERYIEQAYEKNKSR